MKRKFVPQSDDSATETEYSDEEEEEVILKF